MRLEVEAKWSVQICGDWSTVISLRDYWDDLIGQNPYDDDRAEYDVYSIPCADQEAIDRALAACREKHLQAHVAVEIKHEHLEVSLHCGDGFSSKNEPCAHVIVKAAHDWSCSLADLRHRAPPLDLKKAARRATVMVAPVGSPYGPKRSRVAVEFYLTTAARLFSCVRFVLGKLPRPGFCHAQVTKCLMDSRLGIGYKLLGTSCPLLILMHNILCVRNVGSHKDLRKREKPKKRGE